jgi:hypothetical protein
MRAALLAAVFAAVFASACGPPPVSHYETLQDGLSIPSNWERTTERVQRPGSSMTCATILPGCPRVTRYYVVSGTPTDVFPQAKQVLVTAGFTIATEYPCAAPSQTPACSMSSTRDGDALDVNVYNPGDDPDVVGAPGDRVLVRITASTK